MRRRSLAGPSRRVTILPFAVCLFCVACGKKGPPLPPLVRLPTAPSEFSADLRGSVVDMRFGVPVANTDNSRPANIQRIDVYAITSRDAVTDAQIKKYGSRVASVDVKAPRDPDRAIDEDEPPADMEPPEGNGLDQGAAAHVSETLGRPALIPAIVPAEKRSHAAPAETEHGVEPPLLPPQPTPLTRTYVAVGVSTRGRDGAFSSRIAVPLVPPPPAPAQPTVTYDEKAISVTWPPVAAAPPVQPPASGTVLPSTPIGVNPIAIKYNVYEEPANGQAARLTATPLTDPAYSDTRIVWGEERCYVVRAVESLGNLNIESAAAPRVCKTLKDTFPPAAPANLQSSPQEGAISLIWEPNAERDLDGYIVMRGPSAVALVPITPTPIQLTQYRDENLQPGVHFIYAVKAVDKAGNVSPLSNTVDEAAR